MIPSDLAARLRMLTEASFFQGEPSVRAIVLNCRDVSERRIAEQRIRVMEYAIGSSLNAVAMGGVPPIEFQWAPTVDGQGPFVIARPTSASPTFTVTALGIVTPAFQFKLDAVGLAAPFG